MKIKVCGMKHNISEVAKLEPDYIGLIFWEGSPRYFEGELPPIPSTIQKVGVFVNAAVPLIIEKVKEYKLQAVQLHGNENPDYCNALRAALKDHISNGSVVEIIKVFSVKDQFDFDTLKPYEPVCDFFLFDTKGKLPGGNGLAFDWQLLQGYPSRKPFFLSGGIGPEQLPQLKTFFERPEAEFCRVIDVNSRFESRPGEKNTGLLNEFMQGIT